MATTQVAPTQLPSAPSLITRLNREWHKPGLQLFMLIVLAHWAEHLAQAFQIYSLHWKVADARGVLGLWFPWLVASETLHYGYAIVMLIGIWVFRRGFTGSSAPWWTAALVIQFWHHIEHLLLFGQALFKHNLFGAPVPTSIVQIWIPRVELHLFYNTVVFIPMVIGMYYHMFPKDGEEHAECGCACRRSSTACTVS